MAHWTLLIVFVASGVVALLAAFAFVGFHSGAAGTRGERIPSYDRSGSAVIVIDVQEDFTTWSHGGLGFAPGVLASFFGVVNRVQAEARAGAIPVLHVRHQFEGLLGRLFARLFIAGRGIAGRPGTRLDSRLDVVASDVDFAKTQGDSFSNPDLDTFLRSRKVDHVVILGLDGVACVNATARGALNRGYRVSLVRDGILTSRPGKWRALLSTLEREGVHVTSANEFAEELHPSAPTGGRAGPYKLRTEW